MEAKNHQNEAYLLLMSDSLEKAKILANDLIKKNYQKKMKVQEIVKYIREKISEKPPEPIIFEGDPNWPSPLLGSVASQICNSYQKQTFIFKKDKKQSRGSVRGPRGQNSVKAMEQCSNLLEVFGGHPSAAGFVAKHKNLEKFKNCLIQYFNKNK